MKRLSVLFAFFFIYLICCTSVEAQMMHNPSLGIAFSQNEGQFPDHVQFSTRFAAGVYFLEDQGITVRLYDKDAAIEYHNKRNSGDDGVISETAYRMNLVGASLPSVAGENQQTWVTNWFLGDDPNHWRGNVPVYGKVTYESVYEGIDLHFEGEYNNLKYTVLVAPGADHSQFKWQYEGVESLSVENGQLVVETRVGPMYEMKPIAWQIGEDSSKIPVKCQYKLEENEVGFELGETYNPALELVIDPVLVFSSSSGSTSDNWGYTATFDSEEYAFGGGIVGGNGYPTTTGAALEDFQGGGWDVGIIKFTQDGTNLVYATYLGGGDSDLPSSLVVDNDELICLGFTGSTDFPVTTGAFMEDFQGGDFDSPLGGVTFNNGTDIFVTRFSDDGSIIVNATYVGGSSNDGINTMIDNNYGDVFRSEVLTDLQGNVYVASNTTSDDFPTSQGAQQTSLQGTQDAVIFELTPDLSEMTFCTYWGGSSNDSGYSIEVDANGDLYAVGGTLSTNLDIPAGGYNEDNQGGTDGYIIKLEAGQVTGGTYVGTNAYDQTFFIELDTNGDVWVTGQTEGGIPVTGGVYSNTGAGQFLQHFNPELDDLLTSTTYGDGGGFFSPINICQTAFLIDNCDRIFISGWGGALNGFGNTDNMPTTSDAYQTSTDGSDFYVVVFEEGATDLLFGSFMGASNLNEHVDGGTSRFSPKGIIYQAVCAGCGGSDNFPTTDGAWSETNNATNCNMAVFKYDLEIQSLQAQAQANPQAQGCIPFTVDFSNSGSTGIQHFWDFDDNGATSTEASPSYTYTEVGEYDVMYISIDTTACNIADTAYIQVSVGEFLNLDPDFTFLSDPCQIDPELTLNYTGGPEYDNIIWDLGDGNTETGENVVYTYDAPGEYEVSLIVTDEFCDIEEVVTETVDVNQVSVNAEISADVTFGCAPLEVSFDNTGSVGVNGIYYLGNGEASQEDNPTTVYPVGNVWEAMYIIQEDGGDCFDTALVTITTINPLDLLAAFVASSPLCQDTLQVDIVYTGGEYETIEFDMGDGTMIDDTENFSYIYESPGFYEVSVVITDEQCDSEDSNSLLVEVDPESGVLGDVYWPNVFSPNPEDLWNRYFRPYISTVDGNRFIPESSQIGRIFDVWELQVYNRWGNLIFESSPANTFWDGTINNDQAEEGVFYYIVRHQMSCGGGELIEEAGHFTLLR